MISNHLLVLAHSIMIKMLLQPRFVKRLSLGGVAFLTLNSFAVADDSIERCDTPDKTHHVEEYHGVNLVDAFHHLERFDAPLVKEWIACEDDYTNRVISSSPWFDKIQTRIKEVESYTPARRTPRQTTRGFYYYTAVDGARGIYFADEPAADLSPILLETTLRERGHLPEGERIREFQPSPDGQYIAFGVGDPALNWTTWRVYDSEAQTVIGTPIDGFHHFYNQISWRNDSSGFYYARFDAQDGSQEQASKPTGYRIQFRLIDGISDSDRVVFSSPENVDDIYRSAITSDNSYLVLVSSGLDTNRVYAVPLSGEKAAPAFELFPGIEERFIFAGGEGRTLYFATSYGASQRRLVAVNANHPSPDKWRALVGEKEGMTIDSVQLIGDRLTVVYLKDAIRTVRIFRKNGRKTRSVEFPYIGWAVSRQSTGFWDAFVGDWRSPRAFFTINGQADPGSLFELNVTSGKVSAVSRPKLAYDPNDFVTEQVFYSSFDDVRVPMYIVYKRDAFKRDGKHPAWLYAYGFNWSSIPYFMPEIIPWMEAGGVYAFPAVRGGGEYGQPWIEGGSGRNAINKVKDYIWAGKWLVENKYAAPSAIIANGGSSSGPLPAAAINMEPGLFAGAVIDIPLLDMIGMFRYLNGVITNGWGDIENKTDFESLLAWSPYQNISAEIDYPPTYVYVGEKDQFAVPMHGYKYAARRRADSRGDLLLDIGWGAGHYIDNDGLVARTVFALESTKVDVNSDP